MGDNNKLEENLIDLNDDIYIPVVPSEGMQIKTDDIVSDIMDRLVVDHLENQESGNSTLQVLFKLFNNIKTNPTNDKFRKIKFDNPTIEKFVISNDDSLFLLELIGFESCNIENV